MTVTGPSSRSVRRPITVHVSTLPTLALTHWSLSTEMRLLLYCLPDTCHTATPTGVFRNNPEHVAMGSSDAVVD